MVEQVLLSFLDIQENLTSTFPKVCSTELSFSVIPIVKEKKKGKRKVWGPSFDTEISFKTMGYTNLKKDSLLQVFSEAFVCYCKSWLSKRIQNFQTLTMKSYPHTPTPLWHPTLQSGSRNTLFGNAGLRPGVISLRNTANRCQDYN